MTNPNMAPERNEIIMKTYTHPQTETIIRIAENQVLCASQLKVTVEPSNVIPSGDY